jgi:hypothetical protein
MAELPGSEAATELLVDTGSQMTILRRDVIERLGVDLDRDFVDRPRDQALGLGGRITVVRLRIRLQFPDNDAEAQPYTLFVRASLSRDLDPNLPSLLGMDVLGSFRLVVSPRDGEVSLEPRF